MAAITPLPIELAVDEVILQFGAGRFLRAFVDRFVQHANDRALGTSGPVGKIVVVQSTSGSRADELTAAGNRFHVLVRGYDECELVDRSELISSISRSLRADQDWSKVVEFATSPKLKWIVTNATEAGYVLSDSDRTIDPSRVSVSPATLAGKLTQLLWLRYRAKANPLTILPCELIERNADRLRELCVEQATLWNLQSDFIQWLRQECVWLANLVDCIVTDGPADHPLAKDDRLLVCAEPYALWAIEKPKSGALPFIEHPSIHYTEELAPFYLRKVRMLNGLHTAMVGKFWLAGFTTVQEVISDRRAERWIRDLLFEEMVPTLIANVEQVAEFADAILERFRNPFQAHALKSIAVNHATKVKVRLAPTHDEYVKLFLKRPKRLSEAMATAGEVEKKLSESSK